MMRMSHLDTIILSAVATALLLFLAWAVMV